MQRRPWLFWLALFVFLLLVAQLVNTVGWKVRSSRYTYSQLVEAVKAGKVQSIKVFDKGAQITAAVQDNEWRVAGPNDLNVVRQDLEQAMKAAGTQVSVDYPRASAFRDLPRYLLTVVPVVLIVGLMFVLFMRQLNSGNSQALAFGRSRVRRLTDGQPRKTFDDVAGVGEAIEELNEIVDFLRHSDRYRRLGAEIPKGVLLMGPPGCGKTLLARAVAGEAEVPFFHLSGSDFVEMFVGVGASRVRDLFEQAKLHRPCIVFIDELDAVGRHRGAGLGGGHDEREQTVNQLLVEMDGFETNSGVIVMAATNRPDILDPALLRPGRFDRRVVVDHPDVKGRRDILELYLKPRPIDPDVDAAVLARQTAGMTGADLFSVVNEGSILAARLEHTAISMLDLEEAIQRVVSGRERRSLVLSESERQQVAYHEAGHALVAHFLPYCNPVHKISILPRGLSLGHVTTLPEEDRYSSTRSELLAAMSHLLGGRVAEELTYGRDGIATGAQNDLERSTGIARSIVCEYGMSEVLGPRTLGGRHGPVFLGRDLVEDRNYSEEMAREIDVEIRRLVDEAYAEARGVIESHRDEMEALVVALLERETLGAEQILAIVGEPPARAGAALTAVADEGEA